MSKKVKVDKKAVGQRIREERKKLNLSREELAELLGLSDYYIGQLERGERQMSLPVLVNITRSLHVSLDYLVLGNTINKTDFVNDFVNDSVNDSVNVYEANKYNKDMELDNLLNKCSSKELLLIKKIIKTILPYVN